MQLNRYVHSLGDYLRQRHGERVHKLSLEAGFTCPNRDGAKGHGGCTFCNNASFSPNEKTREDLSAQLARGRAHVERRFGTKKYLAYFQAYTNTYEEVETLDRLYRAALAEQAVIGLSVGTRPDCVPNPVLDLLQGYQDEGYEVWLELGLQSAFDDSLARVNRGHGFAEYADAVRRTRARGIKLCTHLIVGLPGEAPEQTLDSLERVLELGVDGLKLHPLHVVKNTYLAWQWRRGEYQPLGQDDYVAVAAECVRRTPAEVVYHRLTGTAQDDLLLAPAWCAHKWPVLNAIGENLQRLGGQGSALGERSWS
ncbi:MAG: TIGR01212 family radical SAM protein [Gammaproteobacteria bacterium]|nr:TIGR01212 family radical SAM protein [Gammaproteobacteria bacterium]